MAEIGGLENSVRSIKARIKAGSKDVPSAGIDDQQADSLIDDLKNGREGVAQRYLQVTRQAEKGDKKALAVVRQVWDHFPTLCDELGNMALQVERSWIEALVGDNPVLQEALWRQLTKMSKAMGRPTGSALEKLLIDRILATWLQVQYADCKYGQGMKDLTMAQGDHQQRRQDRAHRRYLEAIIALAKIRRLQVPVVQVNIAEKQVNVAAGGE